MALRLMQVFLPQNADTRELLEGLEILGSWRDAVEDSRVVLHLLVPAEQTEPIMDRLEGAFGSSRGFHVVLSPVEAVLPRHEPLEAEAGLLPASDDTGEEPHPRISREELYHDVVETLGVSRVFLAMAVLSSVVAAVGLLRDDVAIVIGAMVIAPLLGPNVAMSLAVTLGDLKLLGHALRTNLTGIALTLVFAVGIGVLVVVDPEIPAIRKRTELYVGDLLLALAAGAAGTLAFTRGLASAVIGVMVAVALMPPVVTFGMLLGAGHFDRAFGALLLVAANVVCVNLAGVGTFLAQGVRPRTWWEEERARTATRVAVAAWFLLLAVLAAILGLSELTGSAGPEG